MRCHRKIGRKHLKLRYKFLFVFFVLFTLILLVDCELRPLVRALAVNQAKIISNTVINQVVLDEMTNAQISYDDLIHVERNQEGKILAVSTNAVKMNELKAAISLHSQEQIGGIMDRTLQIPLGTLIDSEFTRGRGPNIPLHLSLSGNVRTEFTSRFESAGVNQTRHQIYLKVSTNIFAIIPGYYNTSTEVETSVVVAETVIVGEVPEVYARF